MLPSPTHPRRGYVLLLVLFVIGVAATIMAAVGRMSLAKSLHASRAEADLQRRWAVLTSRSVLLPRAEAILAKAPESASEIRREITLNGQSFTLIFGDEQAKANVNLLYAQSGLAGGIRDVAIVAAAGGGTPVELRPIPGRGKNFGSADADDEEPPAFESFGQIFRFPSPRDLTLCMAHAPRSVPTSPAGATARSTSRGRRSRPFAPPAPGGSPPARSPGCSTSEQRIPISTPANCSTSSSSPTSGERRSKTC